MTSRLVLGPAALLPALAALIAAAPAVADDLGIRMPGRYFAPARVEAVRGDQVTWRNLDVVQHTTTSRDGLWSSGPLGHGGSFSFRFQKLGTYSFFCAIHTYMAGEVDVAGATLTGPSSALAGQDVQLAGRVAGGTPTVALERQAADGSWMPAGTTMPGADGRFSFTVAPQETTSYRAVSADGPSAPARVQVVSAYKVALTVKPGRKSSLLRVRQQPRGSGLVAVLQLYSYPRFDWLAAATAKVDRKGRASFRVKLRPRLIARVQLVRRKHGAPLATSIAVRVRNGHRVRDPYPALPPSTTGGGSMPMPMPAMP